MFPVWSLVLWVGAGEPEAPSSDDDLPPIPTATQAATGPALNYYSLITLEEVEAELERRHLGQDPLPVILERVTRGLVAAPYVLSPLGEGSGPDADPRFRLDAFDCTTFVETALAMTLCDELPEARALLDRIRYHGPPSFGARRHLMTSQWIPGLIAEGHLVDITKKVGGVWTRTATLELTDERWARRRVAKELVLPEVPLGTWRLDYLPVADLAHFADQIPAGTIINVVRADAPSSPDLITHQALVLMRPDGTRFVRHASPVSRRVVDETITKIITRYQKPRAWPILGINLLAIADASDPSIPAGSLRAADQGASAPTPRAGQR